MSIASLPSTRPVANIYIDCQNVGSSTYDKIIAHLTVKEHYTVNRIFIYGNWTKIDSPEQSWRSAVKQLNIVTVERNVTSTAKDAADDMIKEDMIRHSHSSEETNADVDFVLVTSDKGFKETIETLQNVGRRMIGIGRYSQHYTIANPPIHVYYDLFIHIVDLINADLVFNAYFAAVRENDETRARLAETRAKNAANVRSLAEAKRSLRVNEWVSNINHTKAVQEKDAAVQEKNKLVAKMNGIVNDKNKAVKIRDQALKEKDDAVKERDQALKEKDDAVKEKDDAVKERDQALKEKDDAVKENDDAIKRKIATNLKIACILKEKDQALKDKNRTLEDMDQTLKEKDQALKEKNEALKEKDQAIRERDQALKEKDQVLKHKEKAKGKDKLKTKLVFDKPPKRKMKSPKGTNVNKDRNMTRWAKNLVNGFIL